MQQRLMRVHFLALRRSCECETYQLQRISCAKVNTRMWYVSMLHASAKVYENKLAGLGYPGPRFAILFGVGEVAARGESPHTPTM